MVVDLSPIEIVHLEVSSGPLRGCGNDTEPFYGRPLLTEQKAGTPVSKLCRKHCVSDTSIYKWKAKFGGADMSEARRLETLKNKSTKLKRLLADAIHNAVLKNLLGKKW